MICPKCKVKFKEKFARQEVLLKEGKFAVKCPSCKIWIIEDNCGNFIETRKEVKPE